MASPGGHSWYARSAMGAARLRSRRKALRELAELTEEAGRPLRSYELEISLYDALLHHFGSIRGARRAAKLADPPFPRRWTKKTVVAEIRRLHRSGVTIRYRDLEQADREDLVGGIRVQIGSIVRARRLARVPEPPRRTFEAEMWDEDRVIEEILERHEAGEPLAYSKAPSRLVSAGTRYFGTWAEAIAAADLDYDAIRLRRAPFSDDELLEQIRDLADGEPELSLAELHDLPLGQTMARRYGSLEKAARKAGLRDWPVRTIHRVLTAKKTIAGLRARKRRGEGVYKTAIQSDDNHLWHSIRRNFGTLAQALEAAGLENDSPMKIRWTRGEVLRRLEQRRDRGLPLHASAVQKDMPRLYNSAVKFFGSYMAAAKRFGAVPRQRSWPKDKILPELRKLARGNKALKSSDVPAGLRNAAARHYGSFTEARKAAGIPGVPGGEKRWTPERVIEALQAHARAGKPLTCGALGAPLTNACWRRFGGIAQALDAAGLARDETA